MSEECRRSEKVSVVEYNLLFHLGEVYKGSEI